MAVTARSIMWSCWRPPRTGLAALVLLIGLASACSRHETAKTLAQRLSKADRVIVLNYDGASMTIRDDLLKQLVEAIAAAPKITNGETLTATPGYTLVFFRPGGSYLAAVPTGAEIIFYIDGTPYEDKSGTLRKVFQRFEEHQASR